MSSAPTGLDVYCAISRRTGLLKWNRIIKKTDWTFDMKPYKLKDRLDL